MAARGKSGYPLSVEAFAKLHNIDPSEVANYQVQEKVPYFLWTQSLGLNPSSPDQTMNDMMGIAIIFAVLLSEKGKQVYKTIEPLLKEVIHMETTAMSSMFQASSAHPALSLPAILLFTSLNERLMLIDHVTAQKVFGLEGVLQSMSQITDIFKQGVTSIGFSTPRFGVTRSPSKSAMAGKGE